MKTICILSYKRTGSNWLCDTLSANDSLSLYEPFSKDPLSFFYTIHYLLKNVYNVDEEILSTFLKIYNYSNFFIDSNSYVKLINRIIKNKPYSINLLKKIQQKIYEIQKNLIFKVFPEQIDKDIVLNDIVDLSDYIIINYRNNLLESFISEQKSLISSRWTSLQKERPYLEKIEWNEVLYKDYIDRTINSLNYFIKNINKKYVLISYEKIHNTNNKIETINSSIKKIYPDFIWNFKEISFFSKENYISNIENNFINKEDFLKSINSGIKIKIYNHE